jgi:hypothetical protein
MDTLTMMDGQDISVRKKRGRPRTAPTKPIRLPVAVFEMVNDWIAAQPDPKPREQEAICRLIEKALQSEAP